MRRVGIAATALTLAPLAAGAQAAGDAGCGAVAVGRVIDARTGLPVGFAQLRGRCGATTAAADGAFRLTVAPGDSLAVRRVGYRPATLAVAEQMVVALVATAARLAPVAVRGDQAPPAARLVARRDVEALRTAGAATLADAAAQLPYVAARGARGEVALSMRGSRAEQVAVTLDGMPLADPATGRADIADIPLAALGSVATSPGADPVVLGSGATGGVLALGSASQPTLAMNAGSFGRYGLEGGTAASLGATRLGVGGGVSRARNDFPFRNTFAATGADSVERRVNADERRASAFASLQHPAAQLLLLASAAEQGMAGEMNVRLYDAARARRRRLMARALASPGSWTVEAGARAFGFDYEDPRQPSVATASGALSVDASAARVVGPATVRAGAGVDRATSTGMARQQRGRGFASAIAERQVRALLARGGARVDVLEGERAQASLTLALEHQGRIAPFVRAAQAFRAPTLYDLFFAAPQRIVARPLRPERVALDAEAGVRLRVGPALVAGSAFVRRTRDAIVWFPGSVGWSPQNVARERVLGAEGSALVATRHVDFQAWLGRYDTELRAGPLVLPTPYVPYLAAGATATTRWRAASLAATLRAMDRRPFAVAPASASTELPAVALVNLHVGYRIARSGFSALLTAGADNVGDVRWESVRGFPAPGRSWSLGLTITP